ncbi:MAG: hypothetical protein IJG13_06130 [Kiritimatiellae bacterium]|nr:hypothetical protein [Kiritimatiellia bacterium]MBQ3344502.1 hypothetical protein [Kiritimatiellia bacterium]
MDEVTKDMVKAQLKSAKTPEMLDEAMVSAMIALVDCQYKTGQRVKRQGLWIIGVGAILALSLICGDAAALRVLCFWRGQ